MEQNSLRDRVGRIIWGQSARFGSAFDQAMIIVILVSIIGLSLSTIPGLPSSLQRFLDGLELVVLLLFTAEYLLRLWTAREPLRYARSGWGLVDLIAILPFWLTLGGNFQALRSLRLPRWKGSPGHSIW